MCSERGWLTLYANRGDHEFLRRGADWEIQHPKGFFQPGVLALTIRQRVLYRWRSVPTAENLNGTSMRPTAAHVWASIDGALAAGDAAADVVHDDNPQVDRGPPPRLLFFAAIVANGWFLRARSFMYAPGSAAIPERFKAAFARLIPFLLFWIVAFLKLPPALVGVVFAGWLIWIVHDVRRVLGEMGHRVEVDEPL